jgi:hypothetical protein
MKAFIVEDAPQTRQELVELFATLKGFEVVGQAGSVREALRGIEAQSLTHFNRRFHELTGESPTHFRGSANRAKGIARNLNARSSALKGLAAGDMRSAA